MAAGPTIAAKFIADTSQMQGDVDKATAGMGNSIGSFAKKAAVAFAAAFAVGEIVDFAKESVKAAMEDAEAQEKLAQTLRNVTGATQDQIAASEEFIGTLSKQTAIADDDLRPAYDQLIRGFKDADKAQQALALATDVSAGTGQDLATVTKAMMKAAMGSTGALGKMGIATKDASGKALTLDEIMASMSETFSGQAAVAANTTAGKMRNASIQFGEFQETIGGLLLPVLGSFAGILTETVIPALSSVAEAVAPFISEVAGGISAFFAAFISGSDEVTSTGFAGWLEGLGVTLRNIFDALAPVLTEVIGGVKAFFAAFTDGGDEVTSSGFAGFLESLGVTARNLWDKISEGARTVSVWFSEKLVPAVQKFATAMEPVLGNITSFITDKIVPAFGSLTGVAEVAGKAIGKIGEVFTDTVLPALTTFATWLGENSEVMLAVFTAVGVMIATSVVPAFISWAISAGAAAIAAGAAGIAALAAAAPFIAIGAIIAAIAYVIIRNWDTIKAGLLVVWEWIQNIFSWIAPLVKMYIGLVVAVWTTAFKVIIAVVTTLWDWISTVFGWIAPLVGAYISLVVTVWTTAFKIIIAVVTTLWDWIMTVFGWIVTGVQMYIGMVLWFWTTTFDAIKLVVTTLWDWIKTVFGWIVTGITTYVNAYVALFTGAWNLIKDGVTAVWQWIVEKFNAVRDTLQGIVNSITGFFSGAWDSIKDGATTVWRWVTDKFQAMVDFFAGIPDKFRNIAGQIVDAIKSPINALLRLWNDLAFEVPRIELPEVDLGPLGKHGGGSLGGMKIDFPNLPLLARGGVLTAPTMFIGGEAGTEIVAPEALLRQIVAEEGGGDTYVLNIYPRQADAADIAYGFRRLELMAGLS